MSTIHSQLHAKSAILFVKPFQTYLVTFINILSHSFLSLSIFENIDWLRFSVSVAASALYECLSAVSTALRLLLSVSHCTCYSICSNYFSRFGLVWLWVCHSICSHFSAASALCECHSICSNFSAASAFSVCHSIFSHFSAASALCVTRFSLKNYQTGRTLSQSVNHSSVCTSKSKFLTNCFPNYHHQTRRLEK